MKEEEIIQAANEYVGHAEEAEEDLSTYCNRKAFEAGAKWMQEKMIDISGDWIIDNHERFNDLGYDSDGNWIFKEFEKAMKQ